MESITNISDIIKDNQMKYGDAARLKVQVMGSENGESITKDEYLDEEQTEKDINKYINGLKIKRDEIHLKYLKPRVIYNLIMSGLCTAVFFTTVGVGNLLINLGINKLLIGILGNIAVYSSVLGGFIYVNQRKFYYSKDEIKFLDKIKNEILRCDGIVAEIYKMKQQGKMFEYDYQRLNKDFENTRNRNQKRNIEMQLQQPRLSKETDERINAGVTRQVRKMSNRGHSVNNVDFEYFKRTTESHSKPMLQRNSSLKEIGKDIKKIIIEKRDERIQEKYPDNSFQRGERRRR